MVATPIGNLQDISLRALDVLNTTTYLVCEHVDRTRSLLAGHDVVHAQKTFIKLADGRESKPTSRILSILEGGLDVALVSDAGTPLVSDPGFPLVREATQRGIHVSPVPGASAITAMMSVCPIPLHTFRFIGFLDPKRKNSDEAFQSTLDRNEPTMFYVSPHDIETVLRLLIDRNVGTRRMFLGREITKLHESLLIGTCAEVLQVLKESDAVRGEFTCVLEGKDSTVDKNPEFLIRDLVEVKLSTVDIVKIVSRYSSLNRNAIYKLVQQYKLSKQD